MLKAAPVTPTFEMVTLALPLLVSTTLSELLLPTFTLPKLKLVVLIPSTLVDATPVPLSGIDIGELGELLISVIEPDTAPAVVGANTALNVAFLPAAMVNGALMPEILNPAPVTLTDEMVNKARTRLFGSWEMNWMAYNFAHDVALPGSNGAPVGFLMYPQAETTEGRLDSLDPDNFKYEITSKETTSTGG